MVTHAWVLSAPETERKIRHSRLDYERPYYKGKLKGPLEDSHISKQKYRPHLREKETVYFEPNEINCGLRTQAKATTNNML